MANPNQIYNEVSFRSPNKSMQDLSNTYKGLTDFGILHPIAIYEIAPGDVIKKSTNVFMRAMPMLAPLLHEVDVYVHDFFVPWRLIWDDYDKFLIPQDGETAQTIPVKPYLVPNSGYGNARLPLLQIGSLWDRFGLPVINAITDLPSVETEDNQLCSLPFRAYQLIWNEYYRDQNLQDPVEFDKTSGRERNDMINVLLALKYRAWEKDYFSSALPRPQKGEPIGIDLGGVPGQRLNVQLDSQVADQEIVTKSGGSLSGVQPLNARNGVLSVGDSGSNQPVFLDPRGSLFVEPSGQGYFTIEMLREAMRLQEFMEQLMRGGSRYAEVVRNMFGEIPDDLRIGRPAYLGGSKQNLVISEVLQQSQSTSDSSLGDMAGHGISIGSDNYYTALFKEHGFVISLLSVRPRSGYMQGVNKLWLKNDRYEEMWPVFAHLGEQPVMNGELYWSWTDGENRGTFGYQPIYTEYRSMPSIVTGDLRHNLDFWHLNRKFASRPRLNADFVQCRPDQNNRIFAVTEASDNSHLIFEAQHFTRFIRCIPRDGTPTL